MDPCEHFRGKKITVMGLGVLGRGVGDTAFLSECGADLIVTDLKSEAELASSLDELKTCPNITYRLGGHKMEDFRDRDMILKSAGVPLDSEFIEEAEAHNIPVEMSAALVAKLTGATIVGVTGTRGKSTVTMLIYNILQGLDRNVYLGGNIRGIATLPLLRDVTKDDIVVMELDSWQLQGFGASKISPQIAVFTSFYSDHMNYYHDSMQLYFNDKANIFKYQDEGDVLFVTPEVRTDVERYNGGIPPPTMRMADAVAFNNRSLMGVHNKFNAGLAFAVGRHFGIAEYEIIHALELFGGVEGRLQFVRTFHDVDIYNDNNATSPDATIAGLKALSKEKNIVLMMGGTDKGLSMQRLIHEIPKYCKGVVLLRGSGTKLITSAIKALPEVVVRETDSLEECMKEAMSIAQGGDIVLFSPAFASFGKHFRNEYDRNDTFLRIVESL